MSLVTSLMEYDSVCMLIRHSSRHQLIHPSEDEGGNSGDDEASELENEHRHLEQSLVDTQAGNNTRFVDQNVKDQHMYIALNALIAERLSARLLIVQCSSRI